MASFDSEGVNLAPNSQPTQGKLGENGGQAQGTSNTMVDGWTVQQRDDYTATTNVFDTQPSAASARIYEWEDEFGDVGPKIPELEEQLFGSADTRGEGIDFSVIKNIEVVQEGPERIDFVTKFEDAGLHPAMLDNVQLAGYTNPTPIQQYTIPAILQGKDVIGIAQTGSGKTAAYLIPILSKLMGKAKKWAAKRPNPTTFVEGVDNVKAEPLVIIVVPTRELAVQIFNEARKFCYRTMLRPCVVYGGTSTREQIGLLTKGCDVLIGTPGRLKDFVNRPQILTLRRLKYTVIDEADEMLGHDWQDELGPVLSGGEQDEGNVKFCLFSATFPKDARDLAKEYLAECHVRFRVGRAGSTTKNIKQVVIETDNSGKRDALISLLSEMCGVRTIVFVNSRIAVDNLDDFLWNSGLPVVSIHGERTQQEREAAMRSFRAGNAPIMIATGVCARGIDVRNVMHVINFELPSFDHGGIEEYIHRIGRTGRIGHRGVATSLFTEKDDAMGSVLARTLLETGQEIPEFMRLYLEEGVTSENVKFETESDFDPNEAAGDDAFADAMEDPNGGAQQTDAWAANDAPAGGAWGAEPSQGENAGGDNWGTDVAAPNGDAWAQPQAVGAGAW